MPDKTRFQENTLHGHIPMTARGNSFVETRHGDVILKHAP